MTSAIIYCCKSCIASHRQCECDCVCMLWQLSLWLNSERTRNSNSLSYFPPVCLPFYSCLCLWSKFISPRIGMFFNCCCIILKMFLCYLAPPQASLHLSTSFFHHLTLFNCIASLIHLLLCHDIQWWCNLTRVHMVTKFAYWWICWKESAWINLPRKVLNVKIRKFLLNSNSDGHQVSRSQHPVACRHAHTPSAQASSNARLL